MVFTIIIRQSMDNLSRIAWEFPSDFLFFQISLNIKVSIQGGKFVIVL